MAQPETTTITDPRFKSLHTDPRFLRPGKRPKQRLLKDDRFKPFATKKSLKKSATILNKHDSGKVEKKESKKPSIKNVQSNFVDLARGQVLLESSDSEEKEEATSDSDPHNIYFEEPSGDSDSNEDQAEEVVELGVHPSTGRHSKRKNCKNSDHEFNVDLDETNDPEILPKEAAEPHVLTTKRIAVVNLDWDHVKPIDLYKVFSSPLSLSAPPRSSLYNCKVEAEGVVAKGKTKTRKQAIVKGQVIKVSIYKSQFGKEQMSKEDVEGPPKELFKKHSRGGIQEESLSDNEDDDDELIQVDEGAEIDEVALRKYQLNRLRYFYAIIELDSIDAAAHVYEEIEGSEFERTANVFDLSYVPEDMQFDEVDLHDECKEDNANYKGVDYATDALRHSKVKLTWDAEDPHRTKVTRLNTQRFTREELDALDFRAFVAPPSSEEEDEEEDQRRHEKESHRSKLRDILGLGNLLTSSRTEGSNELDVTFQPAFGGTNAPISKTPHGTSEVPNLSKKSQFNQSDEALNKLNLKQHTEDSYRTQLSKKSKKQAHRKKSASPDPSSSSDPESHQGKPSKPEELALLFDTDEERDSARSHFDLTQIIKAEKLEGRFKSFKKRLIKDSKMSEAMERGDTFEIDVDDERFNLVNVDHEFAIDPSNPQYKKTKNMSKLLQAIRSQRNLEGEIETQTSRTSSNPAATATTSKKKTAGRGVIEEDDDHRLSSLVATLKKQHDGSKKRKRSGA